MKTNLQTALPAFLTATASIIACFPLFHNGLYRGDDWLFEIVRVADYYSSFGYGVFPVRWSPNLEGGYGSPIYNFFPPFPLTVTGMFMKAGASAVFSLKLTTFLFTLIGAIGMFLFSREYFGVKGAVLSSCLFVLSPYHFEDAFFRNAYSEFAAMNIAPLAFYGLAGMFRNRSSRTAETVLILSLTLFILSHNLSAIMYLPVFFIFIAVVLTTEHTISAVPRLIRPFVVSLCLSAFYTLPLLFEKQYIQLHWITFGKMNVLNNLVPLASLFTLRGPYVTASLSVLFILVTAAAISLPGRRFISKETRPLVYSFMLLSLLYLVFMTTAAESAWKNLEILKIFQFPSRLMSPLSLAACFIAGSLLADPNSAGRQRYALAFLAVVISAVIIFTGYSLKGASYTDFFFHTERKIYNAQYMDGERLSMPMDRLLTLFNGRDPINEVISGYALRATVLYEYRPAWATKYPSPKYPGMLISSDGLAEIRKLETRPDFISYRLRSVSAARYTAHIFYFPGWKIYANGKEIPFSVSVEGLPEFDLQAGDYTVGLKFENTPVRSAGNMISLACLLAMAGVAVRGLFFRTRT